MSDLNSAMRFGQVRTEPEKNKWVFNMRVKIEPYLSHTARATAEERPEA